MMIPDMTQLPPGESSPFGHVCTEMDSHLELPHDFQIFAVGWLGNQPPTVGSVPDALIDRLIDAEDNGRILSDGTLGWHVCEICSPIPTAKNSKMAVNPWRSRDIRAQGHGHYLVRLGESVYMCPAMIIHYILGHSYAPPPGFVEAVINGQFLTLGDLEFKMDYIEGASMIRPARTWETARLRAKPADLEDLHVLHADYARDPEMTKFLTWKPHKDLEETRDFLRQCALRWLDGSGFPWSLWLKDSGALAGLIEIRGRGNKVDVGYALARRWWRQGLMTEALSFVVQWSLSQPDIHRVWATCDINNVASIRLLERVGMNREGVLRRWDLHPNLSDQPRDCYSYAIVKD